MLVLSRIWTAAVSQQNILTVTKQIATKHIMILTTTQFSECTTCTGPLAFLWTASWMMRPVTPSIRMIPIKLRSWCRSVLSVTTASRLGFRYCKKLDETLNQGWITHILFIGNNLYTNEYIKHFNILCYGLFSDRQICQIFITCSIVGCTIKQQSSTFTW